MKWLFISFTIAASLRAAGYTTSIGDAFVYNVTAMAADAGGYVYVTGSRQVIVSASTGQTAPDVFVTKLDPAGDVAFTITLAGKGADLATAIAVDLSGNVFVGGSTSSADFPLFKPLQTQASASGNTGFLVKLSGSGTVLSSSYFGGTLGPSSISGLATDSRGNVYVTGSTAASDFPQTSGLPAASVGGEAPGRTGAMVAEVSGTSGQMVYSGVIAGSMPECQPSSTCFLSQRTTRGAGIAVDASGTVYILGNTNTVDLPVTPGVLQKNGIGAFVAKINAGGTGLAYLTYIASGVLDVIVSGNPATPANSASAIAIDSAGNAYVAGSTADKNFPATPGSVQPTFGDGAGINSANTPPPDAFVAKLKPDGSGMVWATYLGGAGSDAARTVAIDRSGSVWVAGTTSSPDFPNSNGWNAGSDFLAGLNAAGTNLVFAARYPAGAVSAAVSAGGADGLVYTAGSSGIVAAFAPAQAPTPAIFGITNAAGSTLSGRIAPGEVISIYGPQIGPATPAAGAFDSSGLLPTTLAGTSVLIGGKNAPLLYVSSSQINAVVPFAAPPGLINVMVTSPNGATANFRANVVAAEPEIFRNPDGSAAALNQDGTVNSPTNPAQPGTIVSIWTTGAIGNSMASLSDGQLITTADTACFYCSIQAIPAAAVIYAGSAPGMVAGIIQINFRLPAQPGNFRYSFDLSLNGYAGRSAFVYIP